MSGALGGGGRWPCGENPCVRESPRHIHHPSTHEGACTLLTCVFPQLCSSSVFGCMHLGVVRSGLKCAFGNRWWGMGGGGWPRDHSGSQRKRSLRIGVSAQPLNSQSEVRFVRGRGLCNVCLLLQFISFTLQAAGRLVVFKVAGARAPHAAPQTCLANVVTRHLACGGRRPGAPQTPTPRGLGRECRRPSGRVGRCGSRYARG